MIRSLQRKFVLINMSLIAAVLLTVLSIIMYASCRRIQESNTRTIERLIAGEKDTRIPPFEISMEGSAVERGARIPQGTSYKPAFCIFLADDGTYTKVTRSDISISDTLLEAAIGEASAAKSDSGLLYALRLRYLRSTDTEGMRIAFVDVTEDVSFLKNALLILLLAGLLGLGAFLLISIFLARWALRPAARAWDQQRQFVADASHELKTPLTVILANTDILLSHGGDPIKCHEKWLNSTREESLHMKGLVEDMLSLARADADHAMSLSRVNLSDLLAGCRLSFESRAYERGVTLEADVSDGVTVDGDELQLQRLLLILLDNAVKYAYSGTCVRLSLHRVQDCAVLSVNNRGDTISPEDLPHIFERFYRADLSRSAEGGYGLGLAIACAIAHAHRGTIRAESTEEAGTTFTVVI